MWGVASVAEGSYRMTTVVTGGCGRSGVFGVILVVMIVVTYSVVVDG